MHITVELHDKQFNINLHSAEGKDAFLSIKGCRLIESEKGAFIGFPARKNEKTEKWWNHVWANEGFQDAVIALVKKAQPKNEPKKSIVDDLENDVPF